MEPNRGGMQERFLFLDTNREARRKTGGIEIAKEVYSHANPNPTPRPPVAPAQPAPASQQAKPTPRAPPTQPSGPPSAYFATPANPARPAKPRPSQAPPRHATPPRETGLGTDVAKVPPAFCPSHVSSPARGRRESHRKDAPLSFSDPCCARRKASQRDGRTDGRRAGRARGFIPVHLSLQGPECSLIFVWTVRSPDDLWSLPVTSSLCLSCRRFRSFFLPSFLCRAFFFLVLAARWHPFWTSEAVEGGLGGCCSGDWADERRTEWQRIVSRDEPMTETESRKLHVHANLVHMTKGRDDQDECYTSSMVKGLAGL
ncbi:hypothetical protein MPTK1_5g18620 [Marchantia polymorpha subsp. ruderalis]|uniref:Uncharacterized protein n=2 Tax=Marchantia polymorpha TaxID=3197 RepID=A0AAF6BJS9_MARPO|nr:hypothetical protein MARPO_0073s0078 [Marchantia polymorpha]BBN12263.1 hypothetical protein Mp_5g18620 [Marchantia polymorpha subsp. ruderalis]|eukprot:PTQ35214.1 hypothetical protein MARPO_0073s0078 [Marchantia polymorpha]